MNGRILLPSYNRAKLAQRFFEDFKETEATLPGWLLVDRSDPQLEMYQALTLPDGWELIETNHRRMGGKFREIFDKVVDMDWIMVLNDDHRPKTKKWDTIVVSQIKGYNIVSTNDGWRAPNKICGAIAISGPILKTLGWIFPPDLNHLYSDDAWEFIAHHAKCANVLMDVMVEHDHVYKHKIEDQTSKEVNAKESWDHDQKAFKEWFDSTAKDDVQRVVDLQPKTGVMIATPTHDGNCSIGYAIGLTDTVMAFRDHNIYYEFARIEGSSLITHARNTLVDIFLKSRCQKLLFVDADQAFDRHAVLRLLSSSRRIVAGVTPHKRFPINLNFEPLEEDYKFFESLTNKSSEEYAKWAKEKGNDLGEVEVARSGTGFIMIDRSVFELMREHVNDYLPFDNDPKAVHSEYFAMGAYDNDGEHKSSNVKKFRGEDWRFCQMAKKLHIPIFINANAIVAHKGHFTFMVGA